jgi:glucose-6-phosphate 1-dehydrogenase
MTAVGSDVAQPAPPCVLVIFGGTGDLTRRLLIPALRNLRRDGLLAENFALIALGSRDIGDEASASIFARAWSTSRQAPEAAISTGS